MYWQKRFVRVNPNKELEEKIIEIRSIHKDYGYRRMLDELRKQGYIVNKKRVQRINENGRMIIKKIYLDPFMDLCNREILSYGVSPTPSAKSIMDSLNTAIEITSDCPYRITFHSDQGWGYQMKAYVHALQEHRIFQSMSRKGNCHDNSVMENFFALMKQEMYYGEVYYSYDELKEAIDKYIDYYNKQRIKEKLGWMSPVEYRLSLLAS